MRFSPFPPVIYIERLASLYLAKSLIVDGNHTGNVLHVFWKNGIGLNPSPAT